MRIFLSFLFGGAMMLAGLVQPAQAQPAPSEPASSQPAPSQPAPSQPVSGPGLYAVTYFEVAPASSRKTSSLLRQFSAASRQVDGNAESTVLHEMGRPGRFAILEAWRDKAAFEAHGAAMKALGDKLQPFFAGPFESRQFVPLSVGAPATGDLSRAIFVLTHVDVFPAGKDEVATLVKTLAEDSRKDAGVRRFDAVVWDGHPNHFHLIAVWSDRHAHEAHVLADHTRQFRAKATPFEGAFYDERLYEVVRKSE
jgi:quinol monooxygenase YgiN